MLKSISIDSTLYDADHKMWFDPENRDSHIMHSSIDFINKHRNKYHMILLQTCPLIYFMKNFKYFPLLMKSFGVLSINCFNHTPIEYNIEVREEIKYELNKYFIEKSNNLYKIKA